jgi:hypothetical protein
MSSTSISLPSVPCCDRRLIFMRRYGEPVNMAIDFDQVHDAGNDDDQSNTTAPAHYINTSVVNTPTFNTPAATFSSSAATPVATATAATTPATITSAGTPASAARVACSECRRKKQKCVRPSGTGSCERCLRARGGPAVCSLAQG